MKVRTTIIHILAISRHYMNKRATDQKCLKGSMEGKPGPFIHGRWIVISDSYLWSRVEILALIEMSYGKRNFPANTETWGPSGILMGMSMGRAWATNVV